MRFTGILTKKQREDFPWVGNIPAGNKTSGANVRSTGHGFTRHNVPITVCLRQVKSFFIASLLFLW